jgi:hypothetical protein
MRAVIYEGGRRKWATDDGAHLLAIQKGEAFTYPDETTEIPGPSELMIRRAVLYSRRIDLVTNTLELEVEHEA